MTLENSWRILKIHFPHIRVTSLTIEQAGTDGEKLSFRMEITALIKSNAS